MHEPGPEIEAKFRQVIGKPIADSTTEDVDRFVSIMGELSQIERNRAARYSSATDIVKAAKHEMNECGCPYDLPDTGDQVSDARRIRVVHDPECHLRH